MSIGAQGPAIWNAVAKAAAFGTAITDTTKLRFFPGKPGGGLKLNRPSKPSDELYGDEPKWMRPTPQQVDGTTPMNCLFETVGEVLDIGLPRAFKSVASFVVTSGNRNLYFNEGGSPLTATVATGTYTAHGLAAAIKAAMDAAGTSFTVTYNVNGANEGLFTITQDTPGTFQLTCTTTTNAIWSLIGFSTAANKTGATTYTGGTQVKEIYRHYYISNPLGRFNVFYVKASTNAHINFKEDGGSEKTATLTPGVYTASELCTEIKTQMETANGTSVVYTISHNATTGIWTIASDGVTSLQLLFQSGTNADTSARHLLGFGAQDITDSSGALSITAGTAVYGSVPKAGATLYDARDTTNLQAKAMFLSALAFALSETDPHGILITPTWLGADMDLNTSVLPPSGSFNEMPGNPAGNITLDFTINGVTYSSQSFRTLALNLAFAIAMGSACGNTVPVKARRGGKSGATFQFQWDLDDSGTFDDLFTAWKTNGDYGSMTLTQNGETIRNSIKQSLVFSTPGLRPIGDTPGPDQGTIAANYSFQCQRDTTGDAPMLSITLTNQTWIPC